MRRAPIEALPICSVRWLIINGNLRLGRIYVASIINSVKIIRYENIFKLLPFTKKEVAMLPLTTQCVYWRISNLDVSFKLIVKSEFTYCLGLHYITIFNRIKFLSRQFISTATNYCNWIQTILCAQPGIIHFAV